MQTLHQITAQFGRKVRRESREAEAGFTLAETLFVLTLAAFGIVGAVLLFNAATNRMTGNRYSTVLQTFSVDNAQMRQQHLVDLTGFVITHVPFAASQLDSPPTISIPAIVAGTAGQAARTLCTESGGNISDGVATATGTSTAAQCCTSAVTPAATTCPSGNAQITPPNPTHRRVMNMPSLVRVGDQWIIRVGQAETISVAWAVQPGTTALGTPFGFQASNSAATDLGCNADARVVYVLAMDPPKTVCDSVADGMAQQDQWSAQCFDSDSGNQAWEQTSAAGTPDTRQSALVACLNPR